MLSFTSRFLAALQDPGKAQRARYQDCVLYQYKSTNTDAAAGTKKKVQILTQQLRARDTGTWDVWHNWEKSTCYGFWTVGLRNSTRCVAENAGDAAGGSLHLLPNGFVLLGRENALLHLLAEEGPVGPVRTPPLPRAMCVLMLLTICVSSYCYMCPRTTMIVLSSFYYTCA